MITDIEDYFAKGCGRCARFETDDCATVLWRPGLAALREICLSSGLDESLRWAHPCYRHGDRNVAIIGAFRKDFRLSFFHAALLRDPAGVLERQGPNTQHPDMIRFTRDTDVETMAPTIRAYLAEAMDYAARGITAPRDGSMPDLPEELVAALDADPILAEAFHALTPGRQKSYVINLNSAKQAATRLRRIAGFRDKILAGKGAQER